MEGWDGDALAGSMEKALGRQQEEAEARRARKDTSSPEDREGKARDDSVRLSRARLAEQLGRATNPAHRAMLERTLDLGVAANPFQLNPCVRHLKIMRHGCALPRGKRCNLGVHKSDPCDRPG